MEIGAHTVNHFDLRHLSVEKQQYEINHSIMTINQNLGLHVLTLAYPSGRYNLDTLKIMKKSGMFFAVTTHPGVATQKNFPLLLPRVRISEKTDFARLF
jgi:peptidoglycan/xylan/chitin deacetylase (PgdA/CDA1 family)